MPSWKYRNLILSLCCVILLFSCTTAEQNKSRESPLPVAVSAHRGACDVAPENTLAAYRKAIDLGADYIEIDTRTTKDGQLVSLHDSTLDRTTNGKGPVREILFKDLRELSAGRWFNESFADEKVPTLDEICQLVVNHPGPHGQVAIYFDWKDADARAWIEVLRKYHLLSTTAVYGSANGLLPLKELAPELKLMPALGAAENLEPIADRLHPHAFDTNWNILSPELIQKAHAKGVKIFSDAMGEHETEAHYLQAIGWGIDLIQTNHVQQVIDAAKKYQSAMR